MMGIRSKLIVAAILACLVSILLSLIFSTEHKSDFPAKSGEQWLLLIAHPDDESMFFAPTLLFLASISVHVHLLCVTSGNSEGLGPVRRDELRSAAAFYGIAPENVHFVDPEERQFPDGFQPWDIPSLSAAFFDFLNRTKPNGLITFDSWGVSGHPNHAGCSEAIGRLNNEGKLREIGIERVLELESVPIWRKYSGFIDLIIVKLLEMHKNDRFPVYWIGSSPFKAMLHHRSQLRWFRFIYMTFSRYMLVNTFVPFE